MGQGKDPVHCSVPTILEFLQSLLDDGRSPSTLRCMWRPYHVNMLESTMARWGATVWCHFFFVRGLEVVSSKSPETPSTPAGDLPLLLDALGRPPFEPLARAVL